jgi:hypothetical protein
MDLTLQEIPFERISREEFDKCGEDRIAILRVRFPSLKSFLVLVLGDRAFKFPKEVSPLDLYYDHSLLSEPLFRKEEFDLRLILNPRFDFVEDAYILPFTPSGEESPPEDSLEEEKPSSLPWNLY